MNRITKVHLAGFKGHGKLCTKCGQHPALHNETATCQTCENRALDALIVMAMRRIGPFAEGETE